MSDKIIQKEDLLDLAYRYAKFFHDSGYLKFRENETFPQDDSVNIKFI